MSIIEKTKFIRINIFIIEIIFKLCRDIFASFGFFERSLSRCIQNIIN